jgi:Histidine kinase-, DNA gyrase B-, and HSP90-like ATPase
MKGFVTPPGGGRVDVWIGRVEASLHIRVSDTGQGISNDFLPHVFERFRQQDGTSQRQHGGLGLGMAIVKELVELRGHGTGGEPGRRSRRYVYGGASDSHVGHGLHEPRCGGAPIAETRKSHGASKRR